MVFLFPAFGIIGDVYGMSFAFYLSATLMGIFMLGFMFWQSRIPLTGQRFFDIMNQNEERHVESN
jgi:hypothetical protein